MGRVGYKRHKTMWLIELLLAFFIAILYATFVEYTMHRFMHAGFVYGDQHAKHHEEGTGKGWYEEFLNYSLPSLTILWFGFLYSPVAGIGFAAGGLLAAAFGAYAHQLQHERPELVFWLPRPVHHLHHKHRMVRHNFGISVDLWDRLFGTYRPGVWEPEKKPSEYPLASFFNIRWF
jgi:sterol desaturase/sphingolipid hydroxylase (fatty acid hydroxylase superfamily)